MINDGSTDQTSGFLSTLRDPRIRWLTLDRNCGRGFVRNLALQHVRGDFVCSLDADDWFFSWKLEEQLQAFQAEPSLAAVTMAMAVTDENGELVGVEGRSARPAMQVIAGPRALCFPFGPTMIRTDLARQVGFDEAMKRGADLDFFLRLLCGRERMLGCIDRAGYVYQGHTPKTINELLEGHRWSREVYRSHLSRFPLDCSYLTFSSYMKSVGYYTSKFLGFSDWLSLRRFSPLAPCEREEYQRQLTLLGDGLE